MRKSDIEYPDFEEFSGRDDFITGCSLSEEFEAKLKRTVDGLVRVLNHCYGRLREHNDISIWSGMSGIAFLYFKLSKSAGKSFYASKALKIVEGCLPTKDTVETLGPTLKVSFYTGYVGPLALGAVLYNKLEKPEASMTCVRNIFSVAAFLCLVNDKISDDIMYGRAGCIAAMMFVNQQLGRQTIPDYFFMELAGTVINSGVHSALQEKSCLPLIYRRNYDCFTGTAYGFSGILHILLNVRPIISLAVKQKIIPSIDYILSLEQEKGKYPLLITDEKETSTDWSFGSAGVGLMALMAYKSFGSNNYLSHCIRVADALWEEKFQSKLLSLAHGCSGKAYIFLAIFQETRNIKYLYRACIFAEWIMKNYENAIGLLIRQPTLRGISLFHGLAGVIYFLHDIIDPMNAALPGLWTGTLATNDWN